LKLKTATASSKAPFSGNNFLIQDFAIGTGKIANGAFHESPVSYSTDVFFPFTIDISFKLMGHHTFIVDQFFTGSHSL
jgi:hypothetical protein